MATKDNEVPDLSDGAVFAKGVTGQISFMNGIVSITRRGIGGRGTVGKGEKRIPARQITAMQLKPAGVFVNGFLQFTLGGSVERRSKLGKQTTDAVSDENSVVFTRKHQPEFEALRAAVEAAITEPPDVAKRTPDDGAPGGTVVEDLRKLGELHDAGVITTEEFEAKKAELLRRI